jgi:hypothetical protein
MQGLQFNLNASNTPQQITSTTTNFRNANFYALSGFSTSGSPGNNKSNIYAGINSGQLFITVAPGANFSMNSNTIEERDNLQAYFAMGSSGDGFYITYT